MLSRLSSPLRRLSMNGHRCFSAMQLTQPTVELPNTGLFIDGQYRDSVSGKTMPTLDPRNEEVICHFAQAQEEDVDLAISAARNAFDKGPWATMSGYERSKIMWKLADLIEENMDRFRDLETWDVGKPLGHSIGDTTLSVETFRYMAGFADKIQGKTIPCNNLFGAQKFAYTLHEPAGVVGVIVPWNFPLLMLAWRVAPLLACGCTAVVKACETTPLTALYFAELCIQAGLPEGVVNIVPGLGHVAGKHLASHKDVDRISFTGSTEVGKQVYVAAAQNMKRATLECGGKSPLIITDCADIDLAVDVAQFGLFMNHGQTCCASTRIYCHESVYDEFMDKTVAATQKRKVGDPFTLGMDCDQGPEQNKDQFEKVLDYIEIGKSEGATLATGGNRIGDKGYFVESTVFGDVQDDMVISQEEVFGPVMQVAKYSDFNDAIRRSNDTCYGLAAGIVATDINKINEASRAFKAGMIFCNLWNIFDAGLPFGGYKESGVGSCKGEYALQHYTQTKVVIQALPRHGGIY